jgi:hypothetical protein
VIGLKGTVHPTDLRIAQPYILKTVGTVQRVGESESWYQLAYLTGGVESGIICMFIFIHASRPWMDTMSQCR